MDDPERPLLQIEEPRLSSSDITEVSMSQKRWGKLRNVFKSVYLFQKIEAKVVDDIDQLIENVRASPTMSGNSRSRSSTTTDAIDEHRRNEMLFEAVMRGSRDDCIQIGKLLDEDPKKFIRSRNDPEALVNRANTRGHRPIYEAALHGHLNVAKLLHDYGADPRLQNYSTTEPENALDVACRWNHSGLVVWLLESANWSKRELQAAAKRCVNPEIRKAVRSKLPKSSWLGCCSSKK